MKKEDGRVRYTKMVIRKSFISLLDEKPASKISVKELCERAEINRATFYAHYESIEALYGSIKSELAERIRNYLIPVASNECQNIEATLERLFSFIKENEDICRVLLGDFGNSGFEEYIVAMLRLEFSSEWAKKKSIPVEYADDVFEFAAIGGTGLIKKWLKGGMKASPGDLAALLIKITEGIFSAFAESL
ncbi:MAG: TetR/AcrR family transcriptional regulator [Ruminococcaceae bacterium]|nr:TetR/AcrR family transcriptional regulator [Oscillospiraceae bacterium]